MEEEARAKKTREFRSSDTVIRILYIGGNTFLVCLMPFINSRRSEFNYLRLIATARRILDVGKEKSRYLHALLAL